MTVGIAGLGLIGGSLAKAYKEAGETVLAFDKDEGTMLLAETMEIIDGRLNEETVGQCDCILIAIYPEAAIAYLKSIAPYVRKDAVVLDCCGTKRVVCEGCFPIAEEYGFVYAGGHPMAGTQHSGLKYSKANMFKGATMIIVPPVYDDIQLLEKIKNLLLPAGFGHVTVTTAARHDEIIAFTSQMAHVVSNAFIKSPTARQHKEFSAGSYKDLTRVAKLNEYMWTQLFMENKDYLIRELDWFIDALSQYRDAMAAGDTQRLCDILAEGRRIKEEVDGR